MEKSIILLDEVNAFLVYLLEVRGYSKETVKTYEIALLQMVEVSHFYEEEGVWILDITPFRFEIVKNQKKTITKKLSAVRSFVKYIKLVTYTPMRLIGDSTIKVPQSLPKPLDESLIEEVLHSANSQARLMILLLYGLGLRISELRQIRLEDVASSWIRIVGKGEKMRELPLLPSLQEAIASYKKSHTPKEYLFEKKEKPMSVAQLRYQIEKAFKAHGIKATPHQLRHSFATHLLNDGARISDVSELLGHESMATTQVYTKLGSAKKMLEYMKAHPLATTK